MRKVLFTIIMFCLGVTLVNADTCEEQIAKAKEAAEKVKVSYEIVETKINTNKYDEETHSFTDETYQTTAKAIRTDVYNIANNLFIVRKEKLNYDDGLVTAPEVDENGVPTNFDEYGNQLIITYADTNAGKFSFTTDQILSYRDYKFDIFPDIDRSCTVRKLKTIEYRQPRYNQYSEAPICEQYPTVELCKEFITYDFELYENDFTEEVLKRVKRSSDSNIVTKKVNPDERKPNFLRDNWLYLTIGGAVLAVGVSVYVIISKKRSSL